MRRLTIAVSVSVSLLLLAGCSNDDEAAEPKTNREVVDDTSTSTGENGSTTANDSGEDSGGGTEEGGLGGAGDRTSEEILDEDGWLEDGRVSIGPGAPQEQEIDLAMCDYVIGDPEGVAERLGVDGDLTLDAESGFGYYGSSGGRLQCLYLVDDVEALLVAIRDRDLETDDDGAEAVFAQTELDDGWFGVVMVNPDWDGAITEDESSVTEWLGDLDSRWGGAGV